MAGVNHLTLPSVAYPGRQVRVLDSPSQWKLNGIRVQEHNSLPGPGRAVISGSAPLAPLNLAYCIRLVL